MSKTKRKVSMPAGIRNKMMAAVSMLMISSIMMVSSTYAWFTLSTAPEVKNISTTVAGNGSLEIALMPADGMLGSITSGFSSDTKNGGNVNVTTANTTWGNIINLSDESYGLNKVELNPAQLVLGDSASGIEGAGPLAIANYGYDGRIDTLKANTILKSCENSVFNGTGYGVRAIGEDDGTGSLGSTYGYAVDLAFRLNTTNNTAGTDGKASLLLQTEGVQRIYSGDDETAASQNADTLGGGSYMSFNANGTGLDLTKLMSAVRVTFVQDYGKTGDGTTIVEPVILGTAKLDVENAVKGATETKAMLYLCETTTSANGEGAAGTTNTFLKNDAAVLVESMEKNAAVQVTAIVWLDGNEIQNSSVAAIKVNDALAQATLNLQFSTNAELKPANNNALYKGSAE